MDIKSLIDLNSLRSAPKLNKGQRKELLEELETKILSSDWMTIGIMAPHDFVAKQSLKSIYRKYNSDDFRNLDSLHAKGSVFLKFNQKTGNVLLRSENGLGEGILITCQYEEDSEESFTYGPFPLDFFAN